MRLLVLLMLSLVSSASFAAVNEWNLVAENVTIVKDFTSELKIAPEYYDEYLVKFEYICSQKLAAHIVNERTIKLAYRLSEVVLPPLGSQKRGQLSCEFMLRKF